MNTSIAGRRAPAAEVQERNVLIVVGSLEVGGAENHIASVMPLLLRKGWRVSVYSLAGDGALGATLRQQNVPVIAPPLTRRTRSQHRRAWLSYLRVFSAGAHLLWVVAWQRPGIIHFFLPEAYLIGGLAAKVARLRVRIMSRRSLNVYSQGRPMLRGLERRLHRSMTAILGNSRSVVRQLEEIEGVPRQRLGLIYNGIDQTKFSPSGWRARTRESLGLSADALVLITVSNLIPYKGHSDLIDALALAAHRMPYEWRLLIVGRDHGIQQDLERKAVDYGLHDRISFLGQRTDVPELLAASDIGLLCSHQEGFSNAVLESMAAGLPMIVTDVGGNAEAVTNGACGIVVPAHSPPDVAEAISQMASDAALRARFGHASRARIEDEFSLSACVAKYDLLYRTLLAGGSVADVAGVSFMDTCVPEGMARTMSASAASA
jgi:glycosyltransferase involved in cell wall biosynthesis